MLSIVMCLLIWIDLRTVKCIIMNNFTSYQLNGNNGFNIINSNYNESLPRSAYGNSALGVSYSGLGDINGDGIDDFGLVAPLASCIDFYNCAGDTYIIYGKKGFPTTFDLKDLTISMGFRIINDIYNSYNDFYSANKMLRDPPFYFVASVSGLAISNTGDVNGDGIQDIKLSMAGADPNGQTNAGSTFIIFGRHKDFEADIRLSQLDGTNGFVINNIHGYEYNKMAVNSTPIVDPVRNFAALKLEWGDGTMAGGFLGDINGDGIDDVVIGSGGAVHQLPKLCANTPLLLYNYLPKGQVYVVYGTKHGFPTRFDLINLNGRNGFTINGIDYNHGTLGFVSTGIDMNGDGISDLVTAAHTACVDSAKYWAGQVYIVYGSKQGFPVQFNLSDLNGQNGFTISGKNKSDFLGENIANLGDVNGDYLDDLLLLSRHARVGNRDVAGEAYIIYGSKNEFPAQFDLNSLDGENGFSIGGKNSYDALGFSQLNGLGDVNGDGINDIIMSAPGASNGAGETYIIYGNKHGFPSRFDLHRIDGKNGMFIRGDTYGIFSGANVILSRLGDINGDNLQDIGFSQALGGSGKLSIIYGASKS